MLASARVWTRVTGGEHLSAPAVMTDPAAPRSQQPGGRDRLTYIDLRWPHLATEARGHYSELRQCLNDYATGWQVGDGNLPGTVPEEVTAAPQQLVQ
jgi:hypothetical protein